MKRTQIYLDESKLALVNLPEKTDSYSPVSYLDIINAVKEQCDKYNLIIKENHYYVNKNGQQIIGKFNLLQGDVDLGMSIMFKNSYDKTMSLGFAAGANVFICSNGMVRGDVVYTRKHTGSVATEVQEKIIESINFLDKEFEILVNHKEKMKEVEISKRIQSELIGRLIIEEKLLTSEQVSIIRKEQEKSIRFPNNTAWDLYNHFTESFKSSHTINYIENHQKLHKFFEENVLV